MLSLLFFFCCISVNLTDVCRCSPNEPHHPLKKQIHQSFIPGCFWHIECLSFFLYLIQFGWRVIRRRIRFLAELPQYEKKKTRKSRSWICFPPFRATSRGAVFVPQATTELCRLMLWQLAVASCCAAGPDSQSPCCSLNIETALLSLN